MKRPDGRKVDELRPMKAEVGVVPSADGSAKFQIGNTIAIAAVRGPRELYPKFLKENKKAKVRCYYNMMPFSGKERVRPGPSRRSKELDMVIEKALIPVLDLEKYPGSAIDIFVELVQTDAGTRCAGICAAAMALADAGLPMKDLISAVSVGVLGKEIIVDLNSAEDCDLHAVDIPVAISPRTKEITLLQLDGEVPEDLLKKAVKKAFEANMKIYEVQKKALLERYGGKKK